MKKIYFILLFCVSALAVNAQSFSLSNVHISGDPLFLFQGHATLTNNSTSPKDVVVLRSVNNLTAGHLSYFCWVQCYTETVDLSPDIMTIPAGSNTDLFKGYLETYDFTNGVSISGISINTYCFYDVNNSSDSVCVEYIFDSTTGIAEIPTGKNFISKPYPNPANDQTNFYVNVAKGTKNAKIKIFNMLGAEVKEIAIVDSKNTVKVNTRELKSGIYFYSLFVNGKNTSTGKLMVTRN